MPNNDPVQNWVQQRRGRGYQVGVRGGVARLISSRAGAIDLGHVPDEIDALSVVIKEPGTDRLSVTSNRPLARLRLYVPETNRRQVFEVRLTVELLEVFGIHRRSETYISAPGVSQISLSGGLFYLFANPMPLLRHVEVRNATFSAEGNVLQNPVELTIGGSATIGGGLDITSLESRGESAELTAASDLSIGSADNATFKLIAGRITIDKATNLTIDIADKGVLKAGRIVGGSFVGPGVLTVLRAAHHSGISTQLLMEANSTGLFVKGSPEIKRLYPGATLIGASDGTLAPRIIDGDMKNARIENLNVYYIDTRALPFLEQLEHLTVWIPDSRKLRIENEHNRGDGVAVVPISKEFSARYHFWRRISEMVAEKGGRGEVQSRLRETANRTRLRSLSGFTRERLLLWLYSLVGYGERIGLPLAIHTSLAVGFAVLIGLWFPDALGANEAQPCSLGEFAWLAWQILISPLAFFRFAEVPDVATQWAQVLLMLVRINGVVMIFFSLAAIRRVARAE